MDLDEAREGELQQEHAIEVGAREAARRVGHDAQRIGMAGGEQQRERHIVGGPFVLELAQQWGLRLDPVEAHAHGLVLLEDRRQRVVAVLGILVVAVRAGAALDAAATAPEVGLALELRVERELEVGEAVERDARQHQLLARFGDELGGVGDAIGFGDEPARDRIAVDALGDVVIHGRKYIPPLSSGEVAR